MRKRIALALGVATILLTVGRPALAEEGMWTFDDFPASRVEQSLGVHVDKTWLDHVQAASVRLTTGCSGAVVSREGLVATNHHCLVECIQALSTASADYVRDGFLTDVRTEERQCPAMQAEVLVEIADVTAAIFAASVGKIGEDYVVAREAAMSGAEKTACGADPKLRRQVISFFRGGHFQVHKDRNDPGV